MRRCTPRTTCRRSPIRNTTASSRSTSCHRSICRIPTTRKTSRCICGSAIRPFPSRSTFGCMGARKHATVLLAFTNSLTPRLRHRASRKSVKTKTRTNREVRSPLQRYGRPSGCKSTRRTAVIARRATLRIRARTFIGCRRKVVAAPTTRTCDGSLSGLHGWRPQPRGTAHAACVTVDVLQQTRVDAVGKRPRAPQLRYVDVKRFDIGQAAAEHDRVRVENIHHMRQRAGEPLFVAPEGRSARRAATSGALDDFVCRQHFACCASMIALESRSGEKSLDAAAMPAKARLAGTLVVARPRQRIVAPFAGDRVGSIEHAAANDDASANAGAQYHAENHVESTPGPIRGLRQREAIGIVGDAHLASKQLR